MRKTSKKETGLKTPSHHPNICIESLSKEICDFTETQDCLLQVPTFHVQFIIGTCFLFILHWLAVLHSGNVELPHFQKQIPLIVATLEIMPVNQNMLWWNCCSHHPPLTSIKARHLISAKTATWRVHERRQQPDPLCNKGGPGDKQEGTRTWRGPTSDTLHRTDA